MVEVLEDSRQNFETVMVSSTPLSRSDGFEYLNFTRTRILVSNFPVFGRFGSLKIWVGRSVLCSVTYREPTHHYSAFRRVLYASATTEAIIFPHIPWANMAVL